MENGFANIPIGQHTIEKLHKEIFASVNYNGYYTLHGLRRTGATRLFENRIPEVVIQSVSRLLSYERVYNSKSKTINFVFTDVWT